MLCCKEKKSYKIQLQINQKPGLQFLIFLKINETFIETKFFKRVSNKIIKFALFHFYSGVNKLESAYSIMEYLRTMMKFFYLLLPVILNSLIRAVLKNNRIILCSNDVSNKEKFIKKL